MGRFIVAVNRCATQKSCATPIPRGTVLWNPTPSASLRAGSCAQNAQGWGTLGHGFVLQKSKSKTKSKSKSKTRAADRNVRSTRAAAFAKLPLDLPITGDARAVN